LLLRFAQDKYEQNYLSTVGVDYYNRTISIAGNRVQLQVFAGLIWATDPLKIAWVWHFFGVPSWYRCII
jgi:hypothetical protein